MTVLFADMTVLARLDLLPPTERRVLQLGSVFGRAFRAAGIAALEGGLAAQAVELCEKLADRDRIRPTDGDRFAFPAHSHPCGHAPRARPLG